MKAGRATTVIIAAVALLLAASVPPAGAAIQFDPVVLYSVALTTGSGSGSIDHADFNADGHPDLVVVDTLARSVSVVLNRGDGTFAARQRTVASLLDTYAVAAGDFNGDGRPDLAVASDLTSLTLGLLPDLTVLLGRGDGTFAMAYGYGTGMLPQQIEVTDFDLDGRLDLAVVGGAGQVTVLRGNGNGSFRSGPIAHVGGGTTSIAVADVNLDRYPDVAVSGMASLASGTVWVSTWNAAAASLSPPAAYPVGLVPEQVAAGDVNGDGRPELVTANAGAGEVSVLESNGGGAFEPYRSYRVGGGGAGVAIADFDGDGNADVVVGRSVANTVSMLAGDGTGEFTLVGEYPVPGGPQAMAVADFDGDGRPDIGAAIGYPGLAVLRNAGP